MRPQRFCDLCVAETFDSDLSIFNDVGVDTIAFNKIFIDGKPDAKKKKIKGDIADFIPAPTRLKRSDDNVKVKHRITIEFSDSSIAHKLNKSENLRKYDVVAVIPTTIAAFQYACSTMEVDIISFQYNRGYTFKINRKFYQVAVERGVYFEIMYGPALKDASICKNIIKTAHLYRAIGKSKNVILTSWAESALQIRGRNDLINLSLIFGIDADKSNAVVIHNPRTTLLKADGRRKGKAPISIPNISDIHLNTEEPVTKRIKMI